MEDIAGSSHKGKQIKSYTISFKLKVVEFAKNSNNSKAARTYGVDRKRVIEWRKDEAKLQLCDNLGTRKRNFGGGKKVGNVDIDKQVIDWVYTRREQGIRVTGVAVKREALRLNLQNGTQGFKASYGWLRRFMKRHNISFRVATHTAQKLPAELEEKRQNFFRFIIRMRKQRGYDLKFIGNMDETPVYLDMPGTRTLHTVGDKTIAMRSTGHEKERVTVMLAGLADGTKLTPMVILKGVRRPKVIPPGIIVEMAPKSWATEDIIITWLQKVWQRNQQNRRLLVWDAYRPHITPKVKKFLGVNMNTDMAVIPGGCTSKLQPMDVSLNKPFKDQFRQLYDEWLMNGAVELTRGGNRKAPPIITILNWIKVTWASITPAMVRKSFVVTGISSAMDGSEDHLIFEDESDEEDPFEGFTAEEAAESAAVQENQQTVLPAMILDVSSDESEGDIDIEGDDYISPDSPGQ